MWSRFIRHSYMCSVQTLFRYVKYTYKHMVRWRRNVHEEANWIYKIDDEYTNAR